MRTMLKLSLTDRSIDDVDTEEYIFGVGNVC